MSEAFPNAEHLFQQAFAASDPASLLLQLLKEHPTYPTLRDLVFCYFDTVQRDPFRAQSLASALVRLRNSIDAPTFGQDTLVYLIDRVLAGMHFKYFDDDDTPRGYGPRNTYLLESLLSGLSLKHGLTVTPDMYGAINEGLNASRRSERSEVLVVGACIQLLLHGSGIKTEMAGYYKMLPEKVAKKLRAQRAAGTVKDPRAIELLELAVLHAETGLQPENDRDDVWAILFPSHKALLS